MLIDHSYIGTEHTVSRLFKGEARADEAARASTRKLFLRRIMVKEENLISFWGWLVSWIEVEMIVLCDERRKGHDLKTFIYLSGSSSRMHLAVYQVQQNHELVFFGPQERSPTDSKNNPRLFFLEH